jgi:hypothetical protein
MNEEQINKLLSQDIDDLLKEIGKTIVKNESTYQAFPPSSRELISVANKYLNKNWNNLKIIICTNKIINKTLDKDNFDTITVISTIADLISSIVIGISPHLVAVVIYKYGLDKLCKEENEQ